MIIRTLVSLLAFTAIAHAATNDLTGLLQKGLFEEEANRNLDAAISNYQSLANAFDKDRQVAATAIFRLGECYRKLGRTNEAVAQYQRIVSDFSDQQTLVTLSQQNLAGLGASTSSPQGAQPAADRESVQELRNALAMEEARYDQKKTMLDTLEKLSPEELKSALPTVVQDPELNILLSRLSLSEQNFLQLKNDYGPDHPKYQTAKALVEDLQRNVDDRIKGIMTGLQAQLEASKAHQNWLEHEIQAAAGSNSAQSANEEKAPITDEEEKEIRRIQDLIANSPDLINATTDGPDHNETPLYQAASEGWLRVATYLLDHGADINIGIHARESPLYAATGSGNKAMVELLLSRGADVNATSFDGARNTRQTCLHLAVEKGFLTVAATLLDHKADVNARDGQEQTPLHRAAWNGRVEIIKLLLAHDADVNAKDKEDITPLTDAVHSGSLEAVNVILAAKPQLDVVDNNGRTPLATAAADDSVAIVQALLAAKADPNAGSKNLPLIGAVGFGASDRTNLTALLLQAGADPNKVAPVRYPYNRTEDASPLQVAVSYREAGIVKLLLDYGGDAKTNYGPGDTTLLHRAALNADLETSKALLVKRADANATDVLGNSVLHYAVGLQDLNNWDANSNRLELVKLLLENHANPNVQNNVGKAPLDLLKEKIGQTSFTSPSPDKRAFAGELADLLRAHGALDNLPNWSGIEITRPSTGFSDVVFRKGTNDANRFTLLELLAVQYQFLAKEPAGGNRNRGQANLFALNDHRTDALSFPDLAHVRIRRPDADGKNWMEQTVDVKQLLEFANCSNDVPLRWGDLVEIPETDHPLNEGWQGFGAKALYTFHTCLSRQIQIVVKGESHSLQLQPDIQPDSGYATINRPFWILPALRESNLLLTSSDLSHIKVTRRDATTGKTHEWTVDCSNPKSPPSFWLRDGDVIEVPEKPGQ